jgi:hypothetical protein
MFKLKLQLVADEKVQDSRQEAVLNVERLMFVFNIIIMIMASMFQVQVQVHGAADNARVSVT